MRPVRLIASAEKQYVCPGTPVKVSWLPGAWSCQRTYSPKPEVGVASRYRTSVVAPTLVVHLTGKLVLFSCTGLSLPSTTVGTLASTVKDTAAGSEASPTRSTARTA